MLVREVMKASPQGCSPATNLAEVTERLWKSGCGALPVLDGQGKVIGIITDRDICVAAGTRNQRPSDLAAQAAMTRDVATCFADDEIHTALKTMRDRKVRRMPVLTRAGELAGLLTMSDLVLLARHDDGSDPPLSYEDVMNTLKCISCRTSISACGCPAAAA